MKSRAFLASLLAPAVSTFVLTAGAPARPPQSDDPEDAHLLREEKVERGLAGFRDRVQARLDLQTAVHDGTAVLDELRQRAADKKMRPEGQQVARKLSADEKQLVVEATRAIALLES